MSVTCLQYKLLNFNELNKNVELRLSVTCDEGDPDFERWKKMYRVDSYEGIEKGVL